MLKATGESRAALLEVFPASVIIHSTLEAKMYDQIYFWPLRLDELESNFATLQGHLQPNGSVWAVMPKKKFARQRGIDFTWEQLQAAGLTTDLVDNKAVTIDEKDYATRFVIRKRRRISLLPTYD